MNNKTIKIKKKKLRVRFGVRVRVWAGLWEEVGGRA
jgi:hypothetical protein